MWYDGIQVSISFIPKLGIWNNSFTVFWLGSNYVRYEKYRRIAGIPKEIAETKPESFKQTKILGEN